MDHSVLPNMDHSVLCLQASNDQNNDACRHYKCLRFHHVINFNNDNGLSHTSGDSFHKIVLENPKYWVMKNDQTLDVFELQCGKLILCKKAIDLMGTVHESNFQLVVHEFVTMCAFFCGTRKCIASIVTRQLSLRNMTPAQLSTKFLRDDNDNERGVIWVKLHQCLRTYKIILMII